MNRFLLGMLAACSAAIALFFPEVSSGEQGPSLRLLLGRFRGAHPRLARARGAQPPPRESALLLPDPVARLPAHHRPGSSRRTGRGDDGMTFADPIRSDPSMRMLEARFHPRRRGQPDFIMVGYLIWRSAQQRERPVFEPARAAVPSPVVSKLQYLIDMTEPGSFERLQSLRSEFWSFVPIQADDRAPRCPGSLS